MYVKKEQYFQGKESETKFLDVSCYVGIPQDMGSSFAYDPLMKIGSVFRA